MDGLNEYSHNSFDLQSLLNSFPGDLEFKQIFSDIGEQMEQNAASIEHCIEEIQSEVNKLCPDVQLQTTSDCFKWLTSCNYNSSKSPFIPQGDLIKFLKIMKGLLNSEENQEEMILDLLWDLSCRSSISFLSPLGGTSFCFLSRTSLHSVEDYSSVDVKSVWDDVRLHLRRFLVNRLESHNEINSSQQRIELKSQCMKQLLLLYPEPDVLVKYQSIQKRQLAKVLQNSLPPCNRDADLEAIAHGYHCAMATLYAMIKEDFNILREILAPSSMVQFIKETYLDTVTEEMAKILESFCELQLKEHAVPGVKTSESCSKRRGTVQALVSPACPQKRWCSSLSLDELKSLSQLIQSFLKLESNIQELLEETFLLLQMPRNSPGVLEKSDRQATVEKHTAKETNIPPEPLLPVKEATSLEFGWRKAFKEIAQATAHCISAAIEGFSTQVLQQEQTERTSAASYTMRLVSVPKVWQEGHMCAEEEQPKQVAKFCSDIMEKLDTMLPLALGCRDDSLQEIRGNLVEACCKVATAVLERLQERGRDVPSGAPLRNLHGLLSTAAYVSQHFTHYDNLMRETTKKPVFLVPIQRYQEFINTLQFQVADYCVRVCATSILQDAESHRWDDYKAFYEGERCSFSIQMWHYFSWALRHDLWTILPAKLAQAILAEFLEKSLGLLASRYARACPSPKRTAQIRLDVTAILICTENILWSICTSVQEVLNPHEYSNNKIFKIHTHCNNLLATLAILTSPLPEIYQTFQHGMDESALASNSSASLLNQPLHWVSCMSAFYPPLLRPMSAGGLNAEGQLKLLLSQPCCKWDLLLETLLHGGGLIPRILLKSSRQATSVEKDQKEGCSVVEAIFKVMYHCHLSPQAFGDVFMSYMEEEQLLDFLYTIPVSVYTESQPEVICCLRLTLMDAVKDTVQQVISLVRRGRHSETNLNKPRVPDHLLQTIPRAWGYIPRGSRRKESNKGFLRLAAQAVSIVISKLPTVIACLPPTIKYFFYLSERKMSKNLAALKKAGLLVWNLIVIICRIFEDGNTVERLTGASLDRWSKEKAALISVCLESILGERSSPCQLTQKVILSIERQKPNWLEHQLLKARTLSINCAFTAVEESPGLEGDAALELTEQKANLMVLDLCHKPGGSEYLRQIYHIMRLNEEYLKEQLLAMNASEEKPLPSQPLKGTLRIVEDQPPVFNPFHVHKMFSKNMLDQSATAAWRWNWSNLLPNYLRLDKMTFSALLRNRWEMMKDETLEEKGKMMLEHLKQIYSIQDSSLLDSTDKP
ncbi:uncharacterized protein KIAA0825 homolog isoform X1 [Mesocricetus auratus]|uniref:Uncharacterized protein KIAA0825 homolog isoform X1 n=1 Tax=Mesocricetus auratus TaxID=10036 RepID=A0A1U8CXP5_MESAU|nr:uncharacterized protein KIAA0825 homolog isoform X1 [Mesocricetus auratus]XP_040585018.1 uncharacterized protein KIAA0825 homolog isoform X1 [Mesocricetus auratus]